MPSEPLRSYLRQIRRPCATTVIMLHILGASIVVGFAPRSDKADAITPQRTGDISAAQFQAASKVTATHAPTPSPSPIPDHYWLQRPVAPEENDRVARFYPYASRADSTYPIHRGVEFVNPSDTPVLAVAPGTVIVAGDDATQVYGAGTDFYGKLMIQELDRRYRGQPIYVLYGHLSQVDAKIDQHVETGDRIGLVGMTGVAEGPHVHLEVRYGENDYDRTVNPELWLAPKDGMGTLAGQILSPTGEPLPEVKLVLRRPNRPEEIARDVLTYPHEEVNPDPLWDENFATGDVEAEDWLVKLYHEGQLYTEEVSVEAGATTWLTIRTAKPPSALSARLSTLRSRLIHLVRSLHGFLQL